MPELPEVENVRLSLSALGVVGQIISGVELRRPNLRTPLLRSLSTLLVGQTLVGIERRAKYLLFLTDRFVLLNHLGMTGSWRVWRADDEKVHDHVVLRFRSGLALVFHDPRRFGILELEAARSGHRWLTHLGIEPLDPNFTGEYLFALTRRRETPIKVFLMDQKNVVGVGNIYASEALHQARVRPSRAARRMTKVEAALLVETIRSILLRAIAAGGSTIRDYRNSQGESGAFQKQFLVYDRAGEACLTCGSLIKSKFIGGRNTFWCPSCQR